MNFEEKFRASLEEKGDGPISKKASESTSLAGFKESVDWDSSYDSKGSFRDKLSPTELEKTAGSGMPIHNPTPDNIEKFVRKIIHEETKDFPKTLKTHIFTVPVESGDTKGYSDFTQVDSQGSIILGLHDAEIEIPFYVSEGELIPFDVIKLGDEEVVYTRDNLNKVLKGIDREYQEKQDGQDLSGYVEVVDKEKSMTDPGFMDLPLRIRDKNVHKSFGHGTGAGSMYVSASEKEDFFDELMEKVSSVEKVSEEELDKIASMFMDKKQEKMAEEFEKEASADISDERRNYQYLLQGIKKLNLKNVHQMKNGQKIEFPEIDGNDINMTKGIIFTNVIPHNIDERLRNRLNEIKGANIKKVKDHSGPEYSTLEAIQKELDKIAKDVVVIFTQDGRLTMLEPNQPMYAIEVLGDDWKIKTKDLSGLNTGNHVTMMSGNNIYQPFNIEIGSEKYSNVLYTQEEDDDMSEAKAREAKRHGQNFKVVVCKSTKSALRDDNFHVLMVDDEIKGFYGDGAKDTLKFIPTHRTEILDKVADRIDGSKYNVLRDLLHTMPPTFYIASGDAQVIEIKGSVKGYIKDPDELRFINRDDRLSHDFNDFSKNAAFQADMNTVYLEAIDRDSDVYSLYMKFSDNNNNMVRKAFENITANKVQGILHAARFQRSEIAEMLEVAGAEGRATKPIPEHAEMDRIMGGDVQSLGEDVKRKIRREIQMAGPSFLEDVGVAVAGEQLGELAQHDDKVHSVLKKLNKWASDAEEVSVYFEKMATEYKSQEMRKVAASMYSLNKAANIIFDVIDGEDNQRGAKDVFDYIGENTDELSKLAYDLSGLKFAQYRNKDEIVDNTMIKHAMEGLDKLHKLAKVARK